VCVYKILLKRSAGVSDWRLYRYRNDNLAPLIASDYALFFFFIKHLLVSQDFHEDDELELQPFARRFSAKQFFPPDLFPSSVEKDGHKTRGQRYPLSCLRAITVWQPRGMYVARGARRRIFVPRRPVDRHNRPLIERGNGRLSLAESRIRGVILHGNREKRNSPRAALRAAVALIDGLPVTVRDVKVTGRNPMSPWGTYFRSFASTL